VHPRVQSGCHASNCGGSYTAAAPVSRNSQGMETVLIVVGFLPKGQLTGDNLRRLLR